MREKNIKLIMELIFIFILPLIIMLFSTSIKEENNFTYDSNGNYETSSKLNKLSFDNSFIKFENGYINKLNFNQLIMLGDVIQTTQSYDYSINNGLINIEGIPNDYVYLVELDIQVYENHKYLLTNYNCNMPIDSNSPNAFIGLSTEQEIVVLNNDSVNNYIFGTSNYTDIATLNIVLSPRIKYSVNFYLQLYDLTQMFGSGKEPTTIEEFNKYINVNDYHPYINGEIIEVFSDSIISENYEINYTIWGKIKNLLIDNLSINDSIILDIILCYTMLWFIMFVIWHFFYLLFDGLVHLFVDWKKRSE